MEENILRLKTWIVTMLVQLKSVAFFDLWYNGENDKRKCNKKEKSEHFCNALTIALGQNKRWAKFEWTVKCRYPLPAMIKNSQLPNSTDWPCVRGSLNL